MKALGEANKILGVLDCLEDTCIGEKISDALGNKLLDAANGFNDLADSLGALPGSPAWKEALDSALQKIPQPLGRLAATEEPIAEVLQVLKLLDSNMSANSAEGIRITEGELSDIVALANQEGGISANDVILLAERWNRSLDYQERGILSSKDVPVGESVDFISQEQLNVIALKAQQLDQRAIANGYKSALLMNLLKEPIISLTKLAVIPAGFVPE